MRKSFALTAVVLAASTCFAQINLDRPSVPNNFHVVSSGLAPAPVPVTNVVPASRLPSPASTSFIAWNPGVPGGIPSYPNCVNVMNFGARADGTNDDSAAFTFAITACTNGGAVYAPAGVYRLNSTITFTNGKSFVIRGDGPTRTVILSYGSSGAFSVGGNTSRTVQSVIGGYSRGSTNLLLSSASGLVPGNIARLLQNNDPSEILGSTANANPDQAQMFRVTAINGNTISIDTPIYYEGYNALFNPRIEQFRAAAYRCGVEDLGVYYYGAFQNNIYFYITDQCWVRNVASSNAVFGNIELLDSYQCVVRDSQTWYHQVYDSNTRYGVQLAEYSTACLVENNILQGNNMSIILQMGATANVIGYNFSSFGFGMRYPTNTDCAGGMACHGDNANFNLFEGNVAPFAGSDEYWGGSRTGIFFRNWWTRQSYYNTNGSLSRQGMSAVFIDSTNYYHNVVGNVLGTPRDIGDGPLHTTFDMGYARRAGYDYPGPVNDTNVVPRTFIQGNYDFVTQTTSWSNNITLDLPPSYYLRSKPLWFGSLPWPAIGPDVNASTSITNSPVIPAQARSLGVNY